MMPLLVGGIIGIVMAFILLWLLLDGARGSRRGVRRRRRQATERSEDAGQRLVEQLAAEMDRVRHGAPEAIGLDASSVRPNPMPAADEIRLHRTLHTTGEGWEPYASTGSRVYRVHTARHRAHVGAVNLYALLGVPVGASDQEITRAYHYHVARIHPDKVQGDPRGRVLAEQKLKQLNHAVQVLRDPARRARHDAGLQV